MDVNGRAVVADFGLSYRLSDTNNSYSNTAAIRWMAPELALELKNEPAEQSDMYSFGSIMNYVCLVLPAPSANRFAQTACIKVLSREKPFQRHQKDVQVYSALYNKEAPFPSRGKDVSGKHWEFIQQCLGSKPSRPSAEDAYKFLRTELDSTK